MLADPAKAFVARYALGRDYHKVLRAKLAAARRRGSATTSATSAIACSPTARRCSKSRWPPESGPRLARQAHAAPHPRRRLVVLPGRDLHRPAAARTRRRRPRTAAPARACIDVCPTRRDRRSLRARCAPLHLVSDDRARRQHSRGTASADRQPDLRLRRLPARLPVEPLRERRRGSRLRRAPRPRRRRSRRAVRAGPSANSSSATAGSAIRRIGYERWSRNIAVGARQRAARGRHRRRARRRAPTTRRRSSASTSPGRSRTNASAPLPRRPLDQERADRCRIVALRRLELFGILRMQQPPGAVEHEEMRVALDRRIAAQERVVVVFLPTS